MSLNAVIKQLCDRLGVNEGLVRWRASEALVLCYHGVVAERRAERWSYDNWVERAAFRQQLQWLAQWLEPTGLAGIEQWMNGTWKKPKRPVLITFDDGYRNNLTEAAPVLKEVGVPALFFLSTGYIGTSRTLWPDEVRVRVLNWPDSSLRLPDGTTTSLPSQTSGKQRLADQVTQGCKRLREADHAAYLDFLRSRTAGVDPMDDVEARGFLSWEEARRLHAMGFELGGHTVDHPILSQLDRRRMAEELRGSKERIEAEVGTTCPSMAYPNGTPQDFNQDVVTELAAAGYSCSFTTSPRWLKSGGDPYRIDRICVPGHTDMETFKFYVSGLHARLRRGA